MLSLETEDSRQPSEPLLVPEGATRELEKDLLQGHGVTEKQGTASHRQEGRNREDIGKKFITVSVLRH